MATRALLLLALACAACTSSSGGAHIGDSGATGADGQPCAQYMVCVQSGNVFNCDCGGAQGVPACPASANPGEACAAFAGGCIACSENTTLGCQCSAAGPGNQDGGLLWSCLGGGQVCR